MVIHRPLKSSFGSWRISSQLMAFWLICFPSTAQEHKLPTVQGRVLDAGKAPIAGAVISPVVSGKSSRSTAESGPNGEFLLRLTAGQYGLTVTKQGFLPVTFAIDVLQGGLSLDDIVLQVEPARFSVTVLEGDGYAIPSISSATKTLTPLRDTPQAITVVTQELIKDQMMSSIGDVVRYVPGISSHQGENNRDQLVIRGNSASADFFVNGVRDDVQYYRDLYNLERVEALKGPNAMIFGRGGAGGVINRVTKEAGQVRFGEVTLQGGSFGNKRVMFDFDQPLSSIWALRLNAMYENSDTFRNFVNLERYGISPTVTITPGHATKVVVGFENFHDNRKSDRGIPSFDGRTADLPVGTYFGNPELGKVRALVNLGSVAIEHQMGLWNIRNRLSAGDYDRGYQNFVPGAVTANRAQVALTAYNNATARRNIFNQTDVTRTFNSGSLRHTILLGAEVGRQLTDNFRNTGYFNNSATSIAVPYANPTISTPVTFRQSATDADNHLQTNVGSIYLQDQVQLTRTFQVIAGLRLDHFDLQYHNNRNGDTLRRIDNLISPRAGIVYKPFALVSFYGSYSVSYLPSSGDQFSSLTTVTQQVKPERFKNYEGGVKWDLGRSLSLTTATYRLDRTNTRSTDPNDPTRIVQTGSQRSNGLEIGASGRVTRAWKIAGGYAYQDTSITSATASARLGAQAGQVPHHTFSLWNNYQIMPRLHAGLGLLNRSDMFATIDNSVTLPGYFRADAAVYFTVNERVRLQGNVENLFDRKYFLNADSNTNISPGSPRSVRVGLTARF